MFIFFLSVASFKISCIQMTVLTLLAKPLGEPAMLQPGTGTPPALPESPLDREHLSWGS